MPRVSGSRKSVDPRHLRLQARIARHPRSLHMVKSIAVLTILAAMVGAAAPALAEGKPVSIVLVHGAFVDGSGWQKVYDILPKDGYEVIVAQNSTVTLDGDVETATRAIARAKYPVVLV